MIGQWLIKTIAHHFRVTEGLFWTQKIYKYGLRLSKLELEPGLHSPHPLSFSLYKGKLLCGEGHGGEIKK